MNILRTKKFILLTLSSFLLVTGSAYFHEPMEENAALMQESIPFSLTVNNVAGRNMTGDQLGKIDWWKNEVDGKYYFFLPSSADLQSLRLIITGADGVFLDGTYVENGAEISVEAREYLVETQIGQTSFSVVFMQSSNLNSLFLHTKEREGDQDFETSGGLEYLKEDKNHELDGLIFIVDKNGNATYQGELENIRGRGNATWEGTDKKSYALKLEKKANICGMGEGKNWLMLPNSFDRSFLRNYLSYSIAEKIGLPFTTESVFVDWYVDGEYQGIYQLCEKIEIKEERIAIDDLEKQTEIMNPEQPLNFFETYENGENGNSYTSKGYEIPKIPQDITGGYLLELELRGRYQEEPSGFVTPNQEEVVISSPTYASEEQVNYISTFYEEMEVALLTPGGINLATGKAFTEYIDVETFAKKYIMEELSKNLDAGLSSQYFFKVSDTKGGKLYAGPVWDYDSAWGYGGSRYGVELSDPYTFYANLKQEESLLWNALYNQPVFYDKVCYFYQTQVLPIAKEEILVNADLYADIIEDSVIMNFYRWNIAEEETVEEKKETFRGRVASIKGFAEERMNFLKQMWAY